MLEYIAKLQNGSLEGYGACDWSALWTYATCSFLCSLLSKQAVHEVMRFVVYWVGNVIYKTIIFLNVKIRILILGADNLFLYYYL